MPLVRHEIDGAVGVSMAKPPHNLIARRHRGAAVPPLRRRCRAKRA